MALEKVLHVQSYAWQAGGVLPFQLKNLPPDFIIREVRWFINITGTKANGEVLTDEIIAAAVANTRLDSEWWDVDVGGYELDRLYREAFGKPVEERAMPAAADLTFDVNFTLVMPAWDPTTVQPDDSSVPARLVGDKSAFLTLAAAGVFGGTIVITGGNVYCCVYGYHDISETPKTRVPEPRQIRMLDPGGQTIPLEPGVYHVAFLTRSDTCDFTALQLTHATCVMDGNEIMSRLLSEQLIAHWNICTCWDVLTGGYQWPGPVLPIISPSRLAGMVSKRPACTRTGGNITIYGTLTTPHLVYWLTRFKDPGQIVQAVRAYGRPEADAEVYEPKTSKGKPLESSPGSREGARKFYSLAGSVPHKQQLVRRTARKIMGK